MRWCCRRREAVDGERLQLSWRYHDVEGIGRWLVILLIATMNRIDGRRETGDGRRDREGRESKLKGAARGMGGCTGAGLVDFESGGGETADARVELRGDVQAGVIGCGVEWLAGWAVQMDGWDGSDSLSFLNLLGIGHTPAQQLLVQLGRVTLGRLRGGQRPT